MAPPNLETDHEPNVNTTRNTIRSIEHKNKQNSGQISSMASRNKA